MESKNIKGNKLMKDVKILNDKFITGLRLINDKEKNRIEIYGLNKNESPIIGLIETYLERFEIVETKIRNIEGKVKKDSIKISFFGAVSAGKSRVLNTILEANLFLSAVSDTTSCFVRVRKSDRGQHYLLGNNSETTFNSLNEMKQKVNELTTHLGKTTSAKLATNKLVEVYLNTENRILKNNTEIVDCPGSNNQDQVTNCIKEYSLESDIFIFVMTCTLTGEEIKFFEHQSTLSSKPDIFVLVNKWDKSDNDKPVVTKKSRDKIKKELVSLLTIDGNFSSEEASKRIFFVSALEMFRYRVNKEDILKDAQNPEAVKMRFNEFNLFEESLSKYIDNPENNKLDRHSREVKSTVRQLEKVREDFKKEILEKKNLKDFQTTRMEDLGNDINEKRNRLIRTIDKLCENISRSIGGEVDTLRTNINRNNINDVNTKLNTLITNVSTTILNIQSQPNEEVEKLKKTYKNVMGIYTSDDKEEKLTLKTTLKKNITLQIIPQKSYLGRAWSWTASWFSSADEEEILRIIENNKEEISSSGTEMRNYVNEFRRQLGLSVGGELNKMEQQLAERIAYIKKYWYRMHRIMEEMN